MDIFDSFLYHLFIYLTDQKPNFEDLKVFRKHNNKLDQSGDLSFSLNSSAWVKYTKSDSKINDFIATNEKCRDLVNDSKNWVITIERVDIINNKLNIFLNRITCFEKTLKKIYNAKENYGMNTLDFNDINIKIEDEAEITNLTVLRLDLLKKVTVNLLKNCNCEINEQSSNEIYLTNKSESNCISKKIVCGVVINNKQGKKNNNIHPKEFYKKRATEMQLMAQHKYGMRVNSESGWTEFFNQLGSAAVTIDLLHVKPSRPVVVNEDCCASTSSKGASFILYNCARLNEIFKKFEARVAKGDMPPLPNLKDIHFGLLNQSEEWEILYVYLMQYPNMIKSCVADVLEGRLNTHNLCVFLDSLCSTFSVYYRRVRVLTEARDHLFPAMHARLHLMLMVQQVLHNGLAMLNIQPIKHM